jgi:hypothetical protein
MKQSHDGAGMHGLFHTHWSLHLISKEIQIHAFQRRQKKIQQWQVHESRASEASFCQQPFQTSPSMQ